MQLLPMQGFRLEGEIPRRHPTSSCLYKGKHLQSPIFIFTVTYTDGNRAGVDLVLIQPFLLYYVNHVGVM